MKPVTYSKASLKILRRMPANTAKAICEKVAIYAATPEALVNNVKGLKGSELIRLRVGDWRVVMNETQVIIVVKIAPRGGAYD